MNKDRGVTIGASSEWDKESLVYCENLLGALTGVVTRWLVDNGYEVNKGSCAGVLDYLCTVFSSIVDREELLLYLKKNTKQLPKAVSDSGSGLSAFDGWGTKGGYLLYRDTEKDNPIMGKRMSSWREYKDE
jgi:hypothetical protein